MRRFWGVMGWLPLVLLTACVASQTEAPTTTRPSTHTPGAGRPAMDRLLTAGDIQVAEAHLRDFGFDPGPVDGIFTAQTQAAVRTFQARYGIPVSGLLDQATRIELLPGLDQWENEPD
jgi:peptidoglycan hydrolase-like protein with peptidoglycan-binding domain